MYCGVIRLNVPVFDEEFFPEATTFAGLNLDEYAIILQSRPVLRKKIAMGNHIEAVLSIASINESYIGEENKETIFMLNALIR